MKLLRLLREKEIDIRMNYDELSKPLMRKLDEIESIENDRLNSGSLRKVKSKSHEQALALVLKDLKSEQENRFKEEVKKVLEGQPNKAKPIDFDTLLAGKNKQKNRLRIKENRKKFFEERDELHNNIELLKYTDYANDMVSAELLGFMLLKETNPRLRETFLYNQNLGGPLALQKLVHGVEHEMHVIQGERRINVKNENLEHEVKAESIRQFKQMVKKSRYSQWLSASARDTGLLPKDEPRKVQVSFNHNGSENHSKLNQYMHMTRSTSTELARRRPSIVRGEVHSRVAHVLAGSKRRLDHPPYEHDPDDSNESISQPEALLKSSYSRLFELKNYLRVLDRPSVQLATISKRQASSIIQAELRARQMDIVKVMNKIEKTDET